MLSSLSAAPWVPAKAMDAFAALMRASKENEPHRLKRKKTNKHKHTNLTAGNSERVPCPSCHTLLPIRDVFDHLEVCPANEQTTYKHNAASSRILHACGTSHQNETPHSSSSSNPQASSSTINSNYTIPTPQPSPGSIFSAQGDGAEEDGNLVECPICGRTLPLSIMGEHIDSNCEFGISVSPSSTTPVNSPRRKRVSLDKLAAELRCTVCMDMFEDPVFLPCGHNFCSGCLDGCFRATRGGSSCPLCKAPAWRRQVQSNRTLAGVVRVFRELEGRSES